MAKKPKKLADSPVPTPPKDLNAPNAKAPAHRWQRGCEPEEVALVPGSPRRTQRIHDAVKALEKSGRIGGVHVTAADRWVRDFEWTMRSSYVDPVTASIRGGGGNSGPELRLAAGVDASTRYREAAQAVGVVGDVVLRAVLGDGCSLRGLARLRGLPEGGRSNSRIADELAGVLETLADHYDRADRHGYCGILNPRRRPVRREKPASDTMAA